MVELQKETVSTYLKEHAFFKENHCLNVTDLHQENTDIEGYVNRIYRVCNLSNGESVIVKQMLPYIRASKEAEGIEHPVLMSRLRNEIAVLTFFNELCPGFAPEILYFDEASGIIIMEDLSDMVLFRFAITDGRTYPDVGKKLGNFLAKLYFYTSDLYISGQCHQKSRILFKNDEAKRLYDLLFISNPLICGERLLEKEARLVQARCMNNQQLLQIVKNFGIKYYTSSECLIHNDLHASNLLINSKRMALIDTEFSGYGAKGIDIGRFTGSLAINYLTLFYRKDLSEATRIQLQSYLLKTMKELYSSFNSRFDRLWTEHEKESWHLKRLAKETLLKAVFDDALAYSVLSLTTRITSDHARSCDILKITDPEAFAQFQTRSLEIAEYTLLNASSFTCIDDFCELLQCIAGISPQA